MNYDIQLSEFDYSNYLLDELNKTKADLGYEKIQIVVSKERSFKLPVNTLLFVIKDLTGSYTLNIKTQPFQIIVYSEADTFDIAKQILDLFILNHKNGSTDSIFRDENDVLIKQDYETSVILRNFVQAEAGFRASLYCFGSYVFCENLSDVRKIEYVYGDNLKETVNFINAQISYAAILNTAKEHGEEISKSLKQEAGQTIDMTLMNDNSQFVKDINKIMFGLKPGNTKFTLNIELSNLDEIFEEEFIINDSSLSTDKVNAPGLRIVLTR